VYNVSYLLRRDGSWDQYRKIQQTSSEVDAWGIVGGDEIKVFDIDAGKIGILICYDVEFPELARFHAENGMQILFVPFLTDTQNGYNRVRLCAQARAIENECYVAIVGAVGNPPKFNNMDILPDRNDPWSPTESDANRKNHDGRMLIGGQRAASKGRMRSIHESFNGRHQPLPGICYPDFSRGNGSAPERSMKRKWLAAGREIEYLTGSNEHTISCNL
jgi:predicted amidohydrolase